MPSNVIAFTARSTIARQRPTARRSQDNVIALATWIGRAIPHRTPTGVYFTTHGGTAPADIA